MTMKALAFFFLLSSRSILCTLSPIDGVQESMDIAPYEQSSSSDGGDAESREPARAPASIESENRQGELVRGLSHWGQQYRRIPVSYILNRENVDEKETGPQAQEGLRRSRRIRNRGSVYVRAHSDAGRRESEDTEEEDDDDEDDDDDEASLPHPTRKRRRVTGRERWVQSRASFRKAQRDFANAQFERAWVGLDLDKDNDPERMAEITSLMEVDGLDKIMLGKYIRSKMRTEERSASFMQRFEAHKRRLIAARRLLLEMYNQEGGGGYSNEDVFAEAMKMKEGTKGLRRLREKPRIMTWERHRKHQELDDLVEQGLQRHLLAKFGYPVDYRTVHPAHLEPLVRDLVVPGIANQISLFKRIYQLLRTKTEASEKQILQFQEQRAKYVEQKRGKARRSRREYDQ